MTATSDPLAADRRFFAALIAGSAAEMKDLLADDFVLIDVMGGSEVPKGALVELVGSGQLKFDSIEPTNNRVRRYGATTIITGQTRMKGRFGDTPFTAHSAYTHVFVEQSDGWRLVAAQGTQIPAGAD